MNTTANTPSRDSHEVRKRLNARQAFFGLARWKVDDSRPNTIRLIATRPPMTSCAGVNPPPSLNVSAMNSSENRPKPAPDATVKKMTENAGCMMKTKKNNNQQNGGDKPSGYVGTKKRDAW